jgi:predicted hydrocarbon binding protein
MGNGRQEIMERVIDQAWESLLASVLKKRKIFRPDMGDEVDLYVPQSRIMAMAEADPHVLVSLYHSAHESARRNAISIVGKLGMPADYFWKFEYWPKARAYSNLEKIVSRVFASIMRQAREGELKITDVNIDPLEIKITFEDCVECAGIEGINQGICYYHAGAISGILSGLISRNLDGFETECHADGDKSCNFTVCDITENRMTAAFKSYMSPQLVDINLLSRLEQSLKKLQARSIGNMVDITYLQIAVANSLLSDSNVSSSKSFDIGVKLGEKIKPVLSGFYGENSLQSIENYYFQLGEFGVEMQGNSSRLILKIKECAEISGSVKIKEMTSFLTGEICGLVSGVMKKKMVVERSSIEGDNLLLTLIPEG